MRVFLVYDRRTGEPVSTFSEPDDHRSISGQYPAVSLTPDQRKRLAVVELPTGEYAIPKAPKRGRAKSRRGG